MNTTAEKLKKAFEAAGMATPKILYNCSDPETQKLYNERRKVFNRQFDYMPAVIVMCENDKQVSTVVRFINENLDDDGNLYQLRVRSGGHDHEGECSATGVILIDLVKMQAVRVDEKEKRVSIQPGIPFKNLTSQLADKDVMIPHGTCGTVAIAGFTMGGGWGPWTRRHGMCCESLIAVTVVLGDGTIAKMRSAEYEVVTKEDHDYQLDEGKGLLWAIRGGGGFSYGIVTELVIKTFPLPAEIIKFQVLWNEFVSTTPSLAKSSGKKMEIISEVEITTAANKKETRTLALGGTTPTLTVLEAWESAIMSREPGNEHLVGTNLQVIARALHGEPFDPATAVNNCVMYGYWQGTEVQLRAYTEKHFPTGRLTKIQKAGRDYKTMEVLKDGKKVMQKVNYGDNLMSEWDRFSFHNITQILQGLEATPFPPDVDTPGPHKISSRLVNAGGLKREGKLNLIESLFSPLLFKENIPMGLSTYITLGAIAGDYYHNARPDENCSFPYRDKQYTIQYQTWWTAPKADSTRMKSKVNENVNRALDWMEVCRDYRIANTSGSFISFKDSSIPTKTYFDKNYADLVKAKQEKSKDPLNHFRSRKTII